MSGRSPAGHLANSERRPRVDSAARDGSQQCRCSIQFAPVGGAKDDQFKALLEWSRIMGADGTNHRSRDKRHSGAWRLGQHLYASLLMSTESGTEAHSIVDSTPGEHGLEVCRKLVQRFGPASAHATFNLMCHNLKTPKGNGGEFHRLLVTILHVVGVGCDG